MKVMLLSCLLSLSAQAATTQTLACKGKMTDDNGFGAGETWLTVTLRNPSVRSLTKLTRTQAASRITVSYPSSYSISIHSASIQKGYLAIGMFTAAEFTTVFIPTKWIGKAGYFRGTQTDFATGGGTYSAKYGCRSSLGEE